MSGIYGITDEVRTSSDYSPLHPQAGGVPHVRLSRWEYGNVGKSEYKALQLTFTNEHGSEYTEVFFPVNEEMVRKYAAEDPKTYKSGPYKGKVITPDEAVAMEARNINRKVKDLLTCYVSEKDANLGNFNSFEEFSKAVCRKLSAVETDIDLRLKLVYDNKNRVSTPRYGAWVKPGSDPAPFVFNQYDHLTPPSQPDRMDAANGGIGIDSGDDLSSDVAANF